MTKEEVVQWLVDNPKDADKVRKLLCPDEHVYQRAAELISDSLSNFGQILAFMCPDNCDDYLETVLELKQKLETVLMRGLRNG